MPFCCCCGINRWNVNIMMKNCPWSPWLKAPRTGATRTLTWIACIHSHTDVNNDVVPSASSASTECGIELLFVFLFWRYLKESWVVWQESYFPRHKEMPMSLCVCVLTLTLNMNNTRGLKRLHWTKNTVKGLGPLCSFHLWPQFRFARLFNWAPQWGTADWN